MFRYHITSQGRSGVGDLMQEPLTPAVPSNDLGPLDDQMRRKTSPPQLASFRCANQATTTSNVARGDPSSRTLAHHENADAPALHSDITLAAFPERA